MKIFRPLQIGLTTQVIEHNGRFFFTVTCNAGFNLLLNEVMLEFDAVEKIFPLMGTHPLPDMGMPKPQGEFLVSGSYYAPEGQPVNGGEVRIRLGKQEKILYIFGPRKFISGLPSKPEPFTTRTIDYTNAFGGSSYKENPSGIGYMDERLPYIEDPRNLIVFPDDRSDPAGFGPFDPTWPQRMRFAGTYDSTYREKFFPGYPDDFDWRYFMVAPEDQRLDNYYNGDEEFSIYNMHQSVKCIQGKLPALNVRCFCRQRPQEGIEEFSELSMNLDTVWFFPDVLIGMLYYRATIEVSDDEATQVQYLLAAYERQKDSVRPIEHYRYSLERRINSTDSLLNGLNTQDLIPINDKCAMELLQERSLVSVANSEFGKNLDAKMAGVQLSVDKKLVEAKTQLQEVLANNDNITPEMVEAIETGLNPTAVSGVEDPDVAMLSQALEKILPGITSGDPSKLSLKNFSFDCIDKITDEAVKFIEKKTQLGLAEIEKLQSAVGPDELFKVKIPDDISTEGKEELRKLIEVLKNSTAEGVSKQIEPLPRMSMDNISSQLIEIQPQMSDAMQHFNGMKAAGMSDEECKIIECQLLSMMNNVNTDELQKVADKFKSLYKMAAHYLHDGLSPHKETIEQITQQFLEKVNSGDSVANGDWACIDLSFKKLDGIDFSGCFLEQVNFNGASLKGTNFTDAIMCRAQLENADLTGANFTRCNIGAVHAAGANFSAADMSNAVLTKGDFTGAKISQCNLTGVEIRETNFNGADLSGVQIPGAMFINATVKGTIFQGAHIAKAVFVQSNLSDIDFSNADLSNSVWAETPLENVCFDNATMIQACFAAPDPATMPIKECSFVGAKLDKANFQGLLMIDANLKHASAENANFTSADLTGADLSEIQASGAQFRKSILKDANLDRANLIYGSLAKAQLENVSFNGANLFSVDFLRSCIINTTFKNCNLDNTLIEEWESK